MTQSDLGTVTRSNGKPTVTFERVLDAEIDAVWAMIATEDGLRRWLAPSQVELQIGGAVDIDFGDDGQVGGEIIDLVPGTVLEYHWRFTGEPDSIIRFELKELPHDQTHLTLVHRLLPEDQAIGYGAGWHAHLDQLASAVTGHDPIDWDERFMSLFGEYQANAVG